MARSVNLMIILGNLGKDPELRYTTGGNAVATLTVATTEYRLLRHARIEQTEWHRVILWNRLAEIAGEYLRKGRQVHIMGQKKTRSYQDKKTSETKYITEIIGHDLQILGGRGNDTPDDAPVYQSQNDVTQQGDTGTSYDKDVPM